MPRMERYMMKAAHSAWLPIPFNPRYIMKKAKDADSIPQSM